MRRWIAAEDASSLDPKAQSTPLQHYPWHYKQDREKRPISFHSIEYFLGQILDFARLRIRPH